MDYNKLYHTPCRTASGDTYSVHDMFRKLQSIGRPDFDPDAFEACGAGAAVAKMMENTLLHPDEHDPASIAYWARRGMVKEFHGEDVPMDWESFSRRTGCYYECSKGSLEQNRYKKWTSFVPMSAFRPENRSRQYPLIFILHGAGNSLYQLDGWGYIDAAARKEWIAIAPSIEVGEVILEILEEAESLWNIDRSRIYVSGFSFGSMNTNVLGLMHSDVFAAVAPCGGFLTNGQRSDRQYLDPNALLPGQEEPFIDFIGTPKALSMNIKLPCITVSGNKDRYRHPVYESDQMEKLLADLNLWEQINDIPATSRDDILALQKSGSPVEQMIGLPFEADCQERVRADGLEFAIGTLKSRDGIPRIRIVCGDNMPHWPTPAMAQFVSDFLEHYSRDPVTKESIYTA